MQVSPPGLDVTVYDIGKPTEFSGATQLIVDDRYSADAMGADGASGATAWTSKVKIADAGIPGPDPEERFVG